MLIITLTRHHHHKILFKPATATFEVLLRLNEIKFSSGVIDERWCLSLPQECRFNSGITMVEYEKAVQRSVYEQLQVVHEGQVKVFFTHDLKNIFSQDYNYGQDYSMGHGSGQGSVHSSAHGSAPVNDDEEDDYPVKEVALCQAWCDVSEINIVGNIMKTKVFWDAVITYFKNKIGSSRGYDSIVSKWKNRVRPRIGAFCTIIHNVEENHESDIEMPSFYNTQGRKKSKTSETTSGSASGGLNLNDEADEAVEKTQELRPMGHGQSKAKKKSAELKNQELNIREAEVREAAKLKRDKLEIQRRTLELAEKEKQDKDILFYNSEINSERGEGGKGVKERQQRSANIAEKDTVVVSSSAAMEVESASVVEETVEKEKPCHVMNTSDMGSYPPLSMQETTSAGDAPGKSSYANVTSKPSGRKLNIRTLFTPGGNGIDVVVLVESIRDISDRFANTTYGFFLGKQVAYPVVANYLHGGIAMLDNGPWFIRNNPLIMKKWHPDEFLLKVDVSNVPVWVKLHGRSSYARVMIEFLADVELKDNIVVAMPRIKGEGHYLCNIRVEYEWKTPRCSSCKVFRHIHEKCLKNTSAGEKKIVKKPSQTSRGVPKAVEPTIEVSNSNPYDVLNLVDNDVEFGTNGGTTNLVNNGATSSGSSFMNTDYDGEFASNTHIGEKIDKIKRQIYEGKLRLLDNDGNPLVPTGIVESESEVEVYDDDMYENHELSDHLQSICDDLDITVRSRKKK
uniref:DUF4283 domain-containing protein n=1 Tax=Tanacetum cinerariifolium TaxID=118510 RepID=A0A6L2JMH7_TANCI|nr:hypothetical protein [Tanacetum cinerariifolium]